MLCSLADARLHILTFGQVNFRIPHFASSGIKVSRLDLLSEVRPTILDPVC
jgi:hypothetical protein